MQRVIWASLVILLMAAGCGAAQVLDQAEVPVTVRIPQMIILELNATELVFDESDFDYVFGDPKLLRVGVLVTKERAVTATISGNIPYTLVISAPEGFLFGANGDLLHVSQLQWRLSHSEPDEPWNELTVDRVAVLNGQPGRQEVDFDFLFTAFWENPAQVYRGEILFTVIPGDSGQ